MANAEEIESAGGLVLALYSLPGAKLKGVRFTQENIESADDENFWQVETGVAQKNVNGWLAFIDPFHLDAESWLRSWNENYAAVPVYGGLASGNFPEPLTQVYLDGEVFEDGGVAIAVGGDVALAGVISQGCTPIGEAWTLTRVEQNLIRNIGNRPAYTVLSETVSKLSPEDQRKAQGNLFIGLVVNEYLDEFHRGDFLVRNLLGGDPKFRRAGRRRAAAHGPDDPVSAPRRRRRRRGHERAARAAQKRSWPGARFTAAACSAATGAAKIFLAAPATTPRWCRSILNCPACPDFSATAKSARSAKRISCTATPPRWRCL